jgi:hypothetical protein
VSDQGDQTTTGAQTGTTTTVGDKVLVVKTRRCTRSGDGKPAWWCSLECGHWMIIPRRQCPCHGRDIVPRRAKCERCEYEQYLAARREQRAKRLTKRGK